MLNNLLGQRVAELANTSKYERIELREGYCSGHYMWNLRISSNNVMLKVPKLKRIPFETAIIKFKSAKIAKPPFNWGSFNRLNGSISALMDVISVL